MTDTRPERAAPSRTIWVALTASLILVIAGGLLFWRATLTATGPETGALQRVSVGRTSCEPGSFSLPAGRTTFEIVNASDRPIEWEILDGVMVVEERENIAPGFSSQLTANLRPGSFAITCGLLSNPRGRLEVTPSATSDAARVAPPVTAFLGPLSEFKVYLSAQSGELTTQVGLLDAAIRAGDTEAAKAAWLAARLPWKRIELVSGRNADLDAAINPLPDYLAGREADPAFTGFHRIEYGLWGQGTTAGLEPFSTKLVADVAALRDRLRAMKMAPADLALGAAQQAERLAEGQATAGEDRWAVADVPEIGAGLEGIAKVAELMQPLAAEADAEVGKALSDSVTVASAYVGNANMATSFAAAGDRERREMADRLRAVGTALRAVNPALGLD